MESSINETYILNGTEIYLDSYLNILLLLEYSDHYICIINRERILINRMNKNISRQWQIFDF